jgi:hypothetical protein
VRRAPAPPYTLGITATCSDAFAPEQLHPKKWVRDPIGERERAIHPLSVALTQCNTAPTAPFDAALPYTTAAALSLAIASLAALPTSFRLGMPAVLIVAALSRALAAYVRRERLRAQADSWLADACSPNRSVFRWRLQELAGVERYVVGRTLRSFVEEVRRPRRPGAPNLNRLQLRAESELLSEVAEALQDPSRAVSPRAVVHSRRLITDCGSPLNCSARHEELRQALKSILADISVPGTTGEHEPQGSPRRRAAVTPRTSRTPSVRSSVSNPASGGVEQ